MTPPEPFDREEADLLRRRVRALADELLETHGDVEAWYRGVGLDDPHAKKAVLRIAELRFQRISLWLDERAMYNAAGDMILYREVVGNLERDIREEFEWRSGIGEGGAEA